MGKDKYFTDAHLGKLPIIEEGDSLSEKKRKREMIKKRIEEHNKAKQKDYAIIKK